MPTTYTPTRSNRAFESATTFRRSLGRAVVSGFEASDLSESDLQEAVGGNPGLAVQLLQASELALPDAMLVFNALAAAEDTAGLEAFRDELIAGLEEIGGFEFAAGDGDGGGDGDGD